MNWKKWRGGIVICWKGDELKGKWIGEWVIWLLKGFFRFDKGCLFAYHMGDLGSTLVVSFESQNPKATKCELERQQFWKVWKRKGREKEKRVGETFCCN